MKPKWEFVLGLLVVTALAVTGLVHAGELDQTETPAPTMKTLDEIYNGVDNIPPAWSQKLPAAERFVLVLDGEGVLDRETGLVWEQAPGTSTTNWPNACYECMQKEVGGRVGWRLPTAEELMSLVDRSTSGLMKLPSGHPFSNVQSDAYWTTSRNPNAGWSYRVDMTWGGVIGTPNSENHLWWCVRGGIGHETNME